MSKQTVYIQDEIMYVDSDFINASKGHIEYSELKHLGFGEFYLQTPLGNIQFARREELKFDGMVGRCHKMYDSCDGLAIAELLEKMHQNNVLNHDFKKVNLKKRKL